MHVLIVNTAERTGGAAIAANRLLHALNHNGIEARMLVRDRKSEAPEVSTIPQLVAPEGQVPVGARCHLAGQRAEP